MAFPLRNHVSYKRIKKIKNTKQEELYGNKPNGLWYGIRDSWIKWTKEEGFYKYKDRKKRRIYKIILKKNKTISIHETEDPKNRKLLILKTLKDYVKFIAIFCDCYSIDWQAVFESYAGIEIRNYEKIFEMYAHSRYFTFNGWDVDSGCIWDVSIISRVVDTKTEEEVEIVK